jgi:transcription elongation factor GreA
MLDEIREKLEGEIEELLHELHVILPDRIEKAVELGDLRENAEYKSSLERQQFVQARLGHLTSRMSELSKIDVTAMPSDRIGFGSKVDICDLEMGKETQVTIVVGDMIQLGGGEVSMSSAMGRGLMGARENEEVTVELPRGLKQFKVLKVITLPEQMGMA